MSIFKNIKNLFIDIKNKHKFKKELSLERDDIASKFNTYNLVLDSKYNHVSTIVNIPMEFQISGTDMDIFNKLNEIVKPITEYLCYDLAWAEYMYVPEFYHIEDADSKNVNDSVTYLAVWKFAPLIMDNKTFITKLLVGTGVIIASIITGLCIIL